jgi:Transglutaminase-like superfamily
MSLPFLRYCLLSVLLIVVHLPVPAQSPKDYSKVDELVKNFPMKVNALADLRVMARELNRQLKTDEEKARAAFYWITHNIGYDCDGYRDGTGIHEAEDVVKVKRAVCSGYANVFKFLCDEFKVPCEIVEGFAIGIGVNKVQEDSLESNHAWNVVKINGNWKLIDATWAAGSANRDCSKQYREFNEFYFFARPDSFILKHFPDSAKWQLLDKPLTAAEYVALVQTDRGRNQLFSTMDTVISRRVGETFRFQQLKTAERNIITISAEDEKGNVVEDVYDSLKFKNGYYYYDYKIKRQGTWLLKVNFWLMKENGSDPPSAYPDRYTLHALPARQVKRN